MPRKVRPAFVIAVVVALSAGATAATAVGVNMIPEVTPPPLGWSVNGAAEPVAAGFQLTHAGRHDEAGSAFWNTVVSLTAPTGIEFDADLGGGGRDGRRRHGPRVRGQRSAAAARTWPARTRAPSATAAFPASP